MRQILFVLTFLTFTWSFSVSAVGALDRNILHEGDLIFRKGVGEDLQSKAIREATHSDWTHVGVLLRKDGTWNVIEATGDEVQINSLDQFISLSKTFAIKRVNVQLSESKISKLKTELMSYLKRPYDKFFEWSDEAIYCAELAWKAYSRALKITLSKVDRFRDLHLDSPSVQMLMKERYTSETQKKLKLDEKIVSVVTMLKSKSLKFVYQSDASI